MGLFSKKEKKRCPVCGGEMGFLSSVSIADGEICEKCEQKLRAKYDFVSYLDQKLEMSGGEVRTEQRTESEDPVQELTIEDVKAVFAARAAETERALAAFGDCEAVFQVEVSFRIEPKALQVGLKRAMTMKGSYVVQGMAQKGSFRQGDEVRIVSESGEKTGTILELIPCAGVDFWTELSGIHKKEVSADAPAWFVMNPASGILAPGDRIVK